jgi:hypothetical protein
LGGVDGDGCSKRWLRREPQLKCDAASGLILLLAPHKNLCVK